jgi:hypothetical protein
MTAAAKKYSSFHNIRPIDAAASCSIIYDEKELLDLFISMRPAPRRIFYAHLNSPYCQNSIIKRRSTRVLASKPPLQNVKAIKVLVAHAVYLTIFSSKTNYL